jgi:hypothetical protein
MTAKHRWLLSMDGSPTLTTDDSLRTCRHDMQKRLFPGADCCMMMLCAADHGVLWRRC